MLELILLANAVWFGLGFHMFALRSTIFAKILVPREQRETPVFETLIATGPFLGGFNFAFCALSLLFLFNTGVFPGASQRCILLFVFALAHGSQFLGNVPVALANRTGKGVWRVQGLMRFIFVTDFALMVFNAVAAAIYVWGTP